MAAMKLPFAAIVHHAATKTMAAPCPGWSVKVITFTKAKDTPVDWPLTFFTLAHVLVLVYWLGGDLGAFYASTILADPKEPVASRLTAAQILSNIDMAPRTALILAGPTGFTLAVLKGWWATPDWAVPAVWVGGLIWLVLAWMIHLRHVPPGAPVRRLDLVIRWAVLLLLLSIAIAPQAWPATGELPLFLRIKLAILAGAIGLGLFIRVALAPSGAAFARMIKDGASSETDAIIARTLGQARPIVLTLWALLLLAACLGLARVN